MIFKFNNSIKKIKDWIRNNKTEAVVLAFILLIGSFLRLYKIGGYMTFLGDEGRDAIIVRRLLVDFDPILIGPGTSIGNMYLGPLYYYMMAPFLLLADFSPVGPAVMVALLGIMTVWLVWYVSRLWFGKTAAFVAATLYSVSQTIVLFSRASWNPNIMPFFALVSIYSIWKVWTEGKYKWLIVLGISMAFAMQSHYLGLILFPVLGVFWTFRLLANRKRKKETKMLFRFSFISFSLFAFLMSPLLIFDARHDWINFQAIRVFFTERQTTVSVKPWSSIPNIWPLTQDVFTNLISAGNAQLALISSILVIAGIFLAFKVIVKKRLINKIFFEEPAKHTSLSAFILLFVWLMFALVGLGVYKQHIYNHYFGFFFAAPFILLGASVEMVKRKSKLIYLLSLVLVVVLIVANINNSHLKYSPNKQLERSETVAEKIIEESGGKKFNIAVIAERNYEGAYQYHLERVGADFVIIDATRADDTIAEQLFVVCELPRDECDPTHNDKAEVANFGWSKIDEEWEVFGVTLFRLVHGLQL